MTGTPFEIAASRTLLETGFLSVQGLDVRAPDGTMVHREVVRHPGAVAIAAVVDDHVILIRQYRAPVDAYVLELPAGKLDRPGEDAAPAAERELVEEVGYRPGELEEIASFWTGPGFTDERITVFLATGCEPVGATPHGPEEEDAEVMHVAVQALPAMLAAGEFEDAKTIVGLEALLRRR